VPYRNHVTKGARAKVTRRRCLCIWTGSARFRFPGRAGVCRTVSESPPHGPGIYKNTHQAPGREIPAELVQLCRHRLHRSTTPRARGRPSLQSQLVEQPQEAPRLQSTVNSAVWLLHKSNVDFVLKHTIFENLMASDPISISNNSAEVRAPGGLATSALMTSTSTVISRVGDARTRRGCVEVVSGGLSSRVHELSKGIRLPSGVPRDGWPYGHDSHRPV
jgi:hypothetical protein